MWEWSWLRKLEGSGEKFRILEAFEMFCVRMSISPVLVSFLPFSAFIYLINAILWIFVKCHDLYLHFCWEKFGSWRCRKILISQHVKWYEVTWIESNSEINWCCEACGVLWAHVEVFLWLYLSWIMAWYFFTWFVGDYLFQFGRDSPPKHLIWLSVPCLVFVSCGICLEVTLCDQRMVCNIFVNQLN